MTKKGLFNKLVSVIYAHYPALYANNEDILTDINTMCEFAYEDAVYGYGFSTFKVASICKEVASKLGDFGDLFLKSIWVMGWCDCAEDLEYQSEMADKYNNKIDEFFKSKSN